MIVPDKRTNTIQRAETPCAESRAPVFERVFIDVIKTPWPGRAAENRIKDPCLVSISMKCPADSSREMFSDF